MRHHQDDRKGQHRTAHLAQQQRVISLVPSLTATLCDIGLERSLVGCTSYCSYPKNLRSSIPAVGGTKDASFAAIANLKPTHVITNTEENDGALIKRLERELPGTVVIETFPLNAADGIADLRRIAEILKAPADRLTACLTDIERARQGLEQVLEEFGRSQIPSVYLIWMNPWMAAGNQSYISSLLDEACLHNQLKTGSAMNERYPVIEPGLFPTEGISKCYWLFSSEPFSFRQRHLDSFAKEWNVPRNQCIKVDGQALSWHGSFLADGYRELARIRRTIATSEQRRASGS